MKEGKMKKKMLAAGFMSFSLFIGGGIFFYSQTAFCFGNCPIGEKCFGDLNCNQLSCNLSCKSVDKLGMDKRCL